MELKISINPTIAGYEQQIKDICEAIYKLDSRLKLEKYFFPRNEKGWIECPEFDFFVMAEIDGKLVGTMSLTHHDIRKGHVHGNCTIVDPPYQSKGINRAMFDYLVNNTQIKRFTCVIDMFNKKSLKSALGIGMRIRNQESIDGGHAIGYDLEKTIT